MDHTETTISKLNKYKNFINLDDFIDFLISKKIVDENIYHDLCSKHIRDRLHTIFDLIDSINDTALLETIWSYLKKNYPTAEKLAEDEISFRTSTVRGGFPRLPPNYVTRKSLVETVKRELLDLRWDRKLVIHGMMGYGKSCLVNEIVRDRTVLKFFDHYVFWINLGDCHSIEYIWQPMSRLYTAASAVTENKISYCHENIQMLKNLLTKLFIETKQLRNSLLILDDACNEDVLTYFDFHCKTVITTQNRNILRNEDALFIEVKTGFSINESLELFKKSLEINDDLPNSAEEIHYICQGHPMLIALIGSYLNENDDIARGKDTDIWDYIKDSVLRGNYRLNEYNENLDISDIVRKCIEKLLVNADLKNHYHDLAIFEQDVNIPPAVLEVLWNKSRDQVRNLMKKLAEKSLVVLFYHDDLGTYIYGIHELLLNYLKAQAMNKIVELHRKLIDGYDRLTNGNYADLPNDNYTLQFIGYHLLKAEAFDKFGIYFDLKFLEAKTKAVGKEDVLRDMDKYRAYITNEDETLEQKLIVYRDFITRCGCNLYSYEKSDILQYALRESKDSVVFEDALELAKKSSHLYFQLQKSMNEPDYSQTLRIKDDVTCSCFVDSPHHILIGTIDGKIKLFYEQSPKEISNFVGHCTAIKSLIVSPDKNYFLSISDDGVVHLWKFAVESGRNSLDFSNNQLPISLTSPKTKQSYWQDMHTPDKGQVMPKARFRTPEYDDYIISAAFCYDFPETYRIVTGSRRGNVTVWDAKDSTSICKSQNRGIEASNVMYVSRSNMDLVAFLCEDIFTYEVRNDKLVLFEKLTNHETCNSLFCYGNCTVAVSEKSIIIWQNYSANKVFEWQEERKKNICSTLTDDNQYLVISTNQSTVFIWDLFQGRLLREFENKGLALSLDTVYDEEKSLHFLLLATDSHTLQMFPVQAFDDREEPQVKGPPLATLWKRKSALAAFAGINNRLQVFSGTLQISESEQMQATVTSSCFSPCGNYVVYGLSDGAMRLFNIKTKKDISIESRGYPVSPVTYIKCYDPHNPDSYRSYSSNSTSSTDSLDMGDHYIGVIVAVTGYDTITIYKDGNIFSKRRNIMNPIIFYHTNQAIIVDTSCMVYVWNIDTDDFAMLSNSHILEEVTLTVAAFCPQKCFLALTYEQIGYFLDIYFLKDTNKTMKLYERLEMHEQLKSACFSSDGCFLATGSISGVIMVWNTNRMDTCQILTLHSASIDSLLFSPNMEPILVTLGEEIAWWNLKPLQKPHRGRGKPKSINILSDVSTDMDISFWTGRKPVQDEKFLLSCLKLRGKAKYISASRDFNSFFAVDDNSRVYIMDIITSE